MREERVRLASASVRRQPHGPDAPPPVVPCELWRYQDRIYQSALDLGLETRVQAVQDPEYYATTFADVDVTDLDLGLERASSWEDDTHHNDLEASYSTSHSPRNRDREGSANLNHDREASHRSNHSYRTRDPASSSNLHRDQEAGSSLTLEGSFTLNLDPELAGSGLDLDREASLTIHPDISFASQSSRTATGTSRAPGLGRAGSTSALGSPSLGSKTPGNLEPALRHGG